MSGSGQKFIGRNRAPRVQIEYDLETGGAQKKVSLPFVMAVMSDLKGRLQDGEEPTSIVDREFEDVDISTFNKFMEGTRPRAQFRVANKLTDEADSELSVDLTFTNMKDFTPGKIAENVGPLNELLTARNQLKSLLSFMDGKPNAEKTIKELLGNETLLKSLAASKGGDKADGEA